MSADATGWVFRHSPFDGVTFAVHLAMADSVNDQHGQLFWMSVENTATKARVSERSVQRSLRDLEASELIARVRYSTQHSPAVYRFLFPDIPVMYESRSGGDTVSPLDSGVTGAMPRGDKDRAQGRQDDTQTQENPSEPKRRATNPRALGTNPRAVGTNPRAEPIRTFPSSEYVEVEKVEPTASGRAQLANIKDTLRPPRESEAS